MKKIYYILFCGIIIWGITGCRKNNQFNILGESNIITTQNDVSLSIKEGTLKNVGATLILQNNTDKEFEYGYPYVIEIKQDEKWYQIDVELNFNLPSFMLKAFETKEINLDWEKGYGILPKGTYRIIKSIDYKNDDDQFENFYVASEFIIK